MAGFAAVVGVSSFAVAAITTQKDTKPFHDVSRAIVKPASGPSTSSGREAAFYWRQGSVSQTVSGSGTVLVHARATACEGWPQAVITVDGGKASWRMVSRTDSWQTLEVSGGLAQGSHEVTVQMPYDKYVKGRCDRNMFIGDIWMQKDGSTEPTTPAPTKPTATTPSPTKPTPTTPAPTKPTPTKPTPTTPAPTTPTPTTPTPTTPSPTTPPPVPSGGPSAATTGVPDGTKLTVHQGDLVITKPGTVVDGLDVRGYLSVKADNVTIKRTIVRGPATPIAKRAVIMSWWGAKNLRIQDSTVEQQAFSIGVDGISGGGFTAERVDVSKVVDPIKVSGNDVTVRDSWLHDNAHSKNDPYQSDGKTHDDSVQIAYGTNILLERNRMEDAHNAAVMVSQGGKPTRNLVIRDNWLFNGGCTVNMVEGNQGPLKGASISGNKFGEGAYGKTCAMRVPKSSPVSISKNVWAPTGTARAASTAQPGTPTVVWF